MVSVEPLWGRSERNITTKACGSRFQSNPCGVEAVGFAGRVDVDDAFQSNPCGVEARCRRSPTGPPGNRFSRTLVGSKPLDNVRPEALSVRFSRTLVGSKPARGRRLAPDAVVSAEPSSGRSDGIVTMRDTPDTVSAEPSSDRSPERTTRL